MHGAMAYHELILPPGTSPQDAQFVRDRLDPFLRDVHAMLRLPMDEIPGLEAGCSFSSTLTLLSIVGGVSQELYLDPSERTGGMRKYTADNSRFKKLLEEYFPWSQEPQTGNEIVGAKAAETLYSAYRCALVHNLGIVLSQNFGGILKVAKGPLQEQQIQDIELSATRPVGWARPTLYLDQGAKNAEHILTVKCLYWGVRQMIEDVLAVRQQIRSPKVVIGPGGGASVATTATQVGVSSGSTD